MEASSLGTDGDGADVFLEDIWPTNQEVRDLIDANSDNEMFRARYGNVYAGDERWRGIDVTGSDTYQWRAGSTYVANPPYFEGLEMTPAPVAALVEAQPLAHLGDPVHPDPTPLAGRIQAERPPRLPLHAHQDLKSLQ